MTRNGDKQRNLTTDEKIEILEKIMSITDECTPIFRNGDLHSLEDGLCCCINDFIPNDVNHFLRETFPEFSEFNPISNKYIRNEYFYGHHPAYWFNNDERILFVLLLRELLLTIKEDEDLQAIQLDIEMSRV